MATLLKCNSSAAPRVAQIRFLAARWPACTPVTQGGRLRFARSGRSDLNFTYIPAHLYYCMFELIKNSLRAVAEHHGVHQEMPPIKARRARPLSNDAPAP